MSEDHRIPTVQQYDIASEGPIEPWLRLIVPDGRINHYQIVQQPGAPEVLRLFWSKPNMKVEQSEKGGVDWHAPMPFLGTRQELIRTGPHRRWTGPPVDTLALNISAWLTGVEYDDPPDTDGSVAKGWRITNHACVGYHEFTVIPHWQVFGK